MSLDFGTNAPVGPAPGTEAMGECLPVVACGTNVKRQAGHEDQYQWWNPPSSSHEGDEMTY